MWAFIILVATVGNALLVDPWWIGGIWGFACSASMAFYEYIRWVKAGRP